MSAAGWMPRASSRSSARAASSWRSTSASSSPARPVADARRERLDLGRHGGEPPLGAFAELLLEPPPLGVGRLDDPAARGGELLGAGQHLGLQAHVGHRQPRRRRDRLDELRVLEHGAVVDQHRDALAVRVDRGDRALAARRGERERPPGLVGVAGRRRR